MYFLLLKLSTILAGFAGFSCQVNVKAASYSKTGKPKPTEFNILYMNSFFPDDIGASLVQMAKRTIIQEQLLPSDSQINIRYENCTCCPNSGLGYATVLLNKYITQLNNEGRSLHAVVGPGCSNRMIPMAHVAAEINLPVFSYIGTAAELNDRKLFKTFIRTSATGTTFANAITTTIKHYGWNKLGVITQSDSALLMSVTDRILIAGAKREIEVTANDLAEDTDTDEQLDRKTGDFKDTSRIIMLNTGKLCDPLTLRTLESCARNGMNNEEYVFVVYQIVLTFSADANAALCVRQNASNALLRTMWPKVFEIHHDFGEVPILQQIYTQNDISLTGGSIFVSGEQFPGWAIALHDAFYLWAVAVNRTLTETDDFNQTMNGTEMMRQCTNSAVKGLMGLFYMDSKADLVSNYVVRTIQPNGTYLDVLKLKAERKSGTTILEELDLELDFWPSGLPKDVPECGFSGCPFFTTKTILVISAVTVGLMILVSLAIMLYIRRLKQWKYMEMPWKLDPIDLIPLSDEHARNIISTSAWSMSKSRHSNLSDDTQLAIECVAKKRHVCRLKGENVIVRRVHKMKKFSTRDDLILIHLYDMFNLRADNLATFLGIADDPQIAALDVVFVQCSRGTLKTVLSNKELSLDHVFRSSFARDILKGLNTIHLSPIKCHGQLNIYNCVVSANWVVKLSDFGLNPVAEMLYEFDLTESEEKEQNKNIYSLTPYELLYVAPELLTEQEQFEYPIKGTVGGDIFALGLILYELVVQESPFKHDDRLMSLEEVLLKAKRQELLTTASLKPAGLMMKEVGISAIVANTIREAANPHLEDRPPLRIITKQLNKHLPKSSESIVGHMMQLMEKYAKNLEKLVHERTAQLEQSQMRADQLLYQMLPRTVADTLKSGQSVPPVTYQSVTVCFCDIVGFTYMCSMSSPMQIVDMLNNCFKQYDAIIAEQGVFKVETIGDAYMMACGLFDPPETNHAAIIASTILAMSELTSSTEVKHLPEMKMMIRAGFHTGPIAAGVIGLQAPRYCLFGDTVNTASRMESTGEPGRVQISSTSFKMMQNETAFDFKHRGIIQVKGKGEMNTYWVAWKAPP